MGKQEHERRRYLHPVEFVHVFLTVCYSNSQGQSTAKRQGKFKKVLNVSFCNVYLSLSFFCIWLNSYYTELFLCLQSSLNTTWTMFTHEQLLFIRISIAVKQVITCPEPPLEHADRGRGHKLVGPTFLWLQSTYVQRECLYGGKPRFHRSSSQQIWGKCRNAEQIALPPEAPVKGWTPQFSFVTSINTVCVPSVTRVGCQKHPNASTAFTLLLTISDENAVVHKRRQCQLGHLILHCGTNAHTSKKSLRFTEGMYTKHFLMSRVCFLWLLTKWERSFIL